MTKWSLHYELFPLYIKAQLGIFKWIIYLHKKLMHVYFIKKNYIGSTFDIICKPFGFVQKLIEGMRQLVDHNV